MFNALFISHFKLKEGWTALRPKKLICLRFIGGNKHINRMRCYTKLGEKCFYNANGFIAPMKASAVTCT